MSSPERQLRFIQIGLIAFMLLCFFVERMGSVETRDAMSLLQWLVVVAALWSAISGFTVQRRINRVRSHTPTSSRTSTPLGRWRAGHLVRLWSATAVGLWGLLLHYLGGPNRLVYFFLVLAMLLLLIWRPGPTPVQAEP